MHRMAARGDKPYQEYIDLIGTVVVVDNTVEIRSSVTTIHCKGPLRSSGSHGYTLYSYEVDLPEEDWWDLWMKER
jgi:hypothetical protein